MVVLKSRPAERAEIRRISQIMPRICHAYRVRSIDESRATSRQDLIALKRLRATAAM
jgi:hypothetical protein